MQAAGTMTAELVMVEPMAAARVDADVARVWFRRLAYATFLVVGVVATVMILGQLGTLAVYGLPAPFLRRREPARVAELA